MRGKPTISIGEVEVLRWHRPFLHRRASTDLSRGNLASDLRHRSIVPDTRGIVRLSRDNFNWVGVSDFSAKSGVDIFAAFKRSRFQGLDIISYFFFLSYLRD